MHRIHLFVTYDGKSPPRLAPQANVKFTCWLRRPGQSIALRDNSIVFLLHYPSRKCRIEITIPEDSQYDIVELYQQLTRLSLFSQAKFFLKIVICNNINLLWCLGSFAEKHNLLIIKRIKLWDRM